ncbi:MAG: PTS system mannose/fructose/sorbose family transporter subunit IID [Elusimicrobiota bacterium]|jgi:PTS system mannose-specific IID component
MIFALLQTFIRSLFLQTIWNFERMQNMGFAFSMVPLLKRAHASAGSIQTAIRRHMTFFNVHPYFAPIIMGVVYSKEKASADRPGDDPTITVLKDSMGAAFGGIGDHVFWGTWRPFCALMALSIGLLVAYPATGTVSRSVFDAPAALICAKWWIVGFLAVFNSFHLWLRWRGLQKAALEGPQVVAWVQSLRMQGFAAHLRRIGLLMLVAMIMVYLWRWNSSKLLIWMVCVLLATVITKRWAFSGFTIFYLVCIGSIILSVLGLQ